MNIIGVAGAAGDRVGCRFLECDIDSFHRVIRKLRGIFIAGLLHCKAEWENRITHMVIEFGDDRRTRHGARKMDFLLAQLNGQADYHRCKRSHQVTEHYMGKQRLLVRQNHPMDSAGNGSHDKTTNDRNKDFPEVGIAPHKDEPTFLRPEEQRRVAKVL